MRRLTYATYILILLAVPVMLWMHKPKDPLEPYLIRRYELVERHPEGGWIVFDKMMQRHVRWGKSYELQETDVPANEWKHILKERHAATRKLP